MRFQERVLQLGISFDQFIGTVIGLALHNGAWADETLSARAWREGEHSDGWRAARKVIDTLFFWQDEHCRTAYISERTREHMPVPYREAE